MWQVYQAMSEYYAYPKLTLIEEKLMGASIYSQDLDTMMPAVTVCNLKPLRSDHKQVAIANGIPTLQDYAMYLGAYDMVYLGAYERCTWVRTTRCTWVRTTRCTWVRTTRCTLERMTRCTMGSYARQDIWERSGYLGVFHEPPWVQVPGYVQQGTQVCEG